MHNILKGIDVYKWGVLMVTLLAGILLGYILIGPFLTSGVLEWTEKQIPIVKELINVESMIVDSLISACVPMFLLWAISFYTYSRFKENLGVLNKAFPLVWLFAQSPATIILFLSSILVGLCIYGWLDFQFSSSLMALSLLAVFFVIIGFILRVTCTPKLEENKFLDKYSMVSGHVCVILTLLAYLWGVLSGPVGLFIIINKNMANG